MRSGSDTAAFTNAISRSVRATRGTHHTWSDALSTGPCICATTVMVYSGLGNTVKASFTIPTNSMSCIALLPLLRFTSST